MIIARSFRGRKSDHRKISTSRRDRMTEPINTVWRRPSIQAAHVSKRFLYLRRVACSSLLEHGRMDGWHGYAQLSHVVWITLGSHPVSRGSWRICLRSGFEPLNFENWYLFRISSLEFQIFSRRVACSSLLEHGSLKKVSEPNAAVPHFTFLLFHFIMNPVILPQIFFPVDCKLTLFEFYSVILLFDF